MKVISAVVAVIMIVFGPMLNCFDRIKCRQEGVFTQYEQPEKTARSYYSAEPGDGDVVLNPGDSLTDAVERVKQARGSGDDTPVTIYLHGGTYSVGDCLDLSGMKNLTLAACENESVTIRSGIEISDFAETTVNGVKAWKTAVPKDASFSTLYRGEEPLSLTRYPESGYLTVKQPDRSTAKFTEETTPWEWTYGDTAFYYGDDLGRTTFRNLTDVRIKLMHYWFCERTTLSYVEGGKLGMNTICAMKIGEGDRYFLENVFEELKKPGQWYLDRQEDALYYVPLPGEKPDETTLFAPTSGTLVKIDGAEHVSFYNVRFVGTDVVDPLPDPNNSAHGKYGMLHPQGNLEVTGAVEISGSRFVSLTNCDVVNTGGTGVRFTGTNTDCEITGCHFKNVGCNGVFIGGANTDDESLKTKRINVTDNLIESYGRNFPSGIGVLLTYASDCDLCHNEVRDGYYTAFSIGWVWGYAYHATDDIRVCDNLIYDIGQGWLSDMGGIYTLGNQPHTVLSGNVIHDVAADPGEGGYGGWGIYLDEGSSGITVTKNLVYDCGSQSLHQHYGKENVVTNNILAFSREGQIRVTRDEEHNELDLTKNIIVGDDQPLWIYAEANRFTESENLFWDYTNFSRVYAVRGDSLKKIDRMYVPALRLKGNAKDDVTRNPLFLDAENRDFTLAENSPAVTEIGFEPWNYKTAGTLSAFD